jgi:hypothetical protein
MNHNSTSDSVEEISSRGSSVVLMIALAAGLALSGSVGANYGLLKHGIYGILEFGVLTLAAIFSFFNYHRYVASIKSLKLPKKCKKCINRLHWHFFFCVVLFILCAALIVKQAPSVWIMLILSTIYYLYIRSNYRVLTTLSSTVAFDSVTASPDNLIPRYVNSVSNSAFFLKQENSVSFIGYILLTVFCAVIYFLSIENFIAKTGADALGAFAAGAAVVHLGISSVKFGRIVGDFREPTTPVEAAAADVIELVLFIVGEDRPDPNAGARADRAASVASSLANGEIMFGEIMVGNAKKVMNWTLFAAIVISTLAVGASLAKPSDSSLPVVATNEQEPHGNDN